MAPRSRAHAITVQGGRTGAWLEEIPVIRSQQPGVAVDCKIIKAHVVKRLLLAAVILAILSSSRRAFAGQSAPANEARTFMSYGLTQTAFPGLLAAHHKARNGLYACTANDMTHNAAVGAWKGTWTNDTYFGLHGMLYVGDAKQQEIYKAELEKVAKNVPLTGRMAGYVPFCTPADGRGARLNQWWGSDYDRRCEFILEVVTVYEASGDAIFLRRLLPICHVILDNLGSERDDPDHDLLLEGRTLPLGFKGVGSCASCTYIGDTVKNDWKDFGASMFFYHALIKLAQVEDIVGEEAEAVEHRSHAQKLKERIRAVFWNRQNGGFTAWIEKSGQRHEDWITGNNFHAAMCGLASAEQSNRIIQTFRAHKTELVDVVPGRVRIGLFLDGYCSDGPEHYWNGGCWVVTTGPMMIVLARRGEWSLLSDIVDRLCNRTKMDDYGFNECYNGQTGVPENAPGLYMNNGGFLWGIFAGVFGVDFDGDDLVLRTTIDAKFLPARAKLFYRGRDITFLWRKAAAVSVSVDGRPSKIGRDGMCRLRLPLVSSAASLIEVTLPE